MKLTLRRKLLGLLAIMYLALVAGTIFSINSVAKKYVIEDLDSEMTSLAEKTAKQIQDYFDARESDIIFIAESRKRELFEEYIIGKESPTQLQYIKKRGIESIINNLKSFEDVVIVDNAGLEYMKFHNGAEILDRTKYQNVSAKEFFRQTRELGGKIYVSQIMRMFESPFSDANGAGYILMSMAYYDEFGRFGGIVAGTIDIDSLSKFAGDIKIRQTGYAWLADRNNLVISHLDKELLDGAGIFVPSKTRDAKIVEIGNNMIQQKKGFDTYEYKGESYFIAYVPLKERGWSLAITVPESEGLVKLNRILKTILIQMTVVFAVLFVFFARLTSNMMTPINELIKASKIISEGNLDVKLNARSQDEIGELASSFQKMAEDLKKSRCALQKSNEALEKKVNERTCELQSRTDELERFNKLAVGRELKMIALKKRIAELEGKNENRS